MTLLRDLAVPPRSPTDYNRVLGNPCTDGMVSANFRALEDEVRRLWNTDIPQFDASSVPPPSSTSAVLGAISNDIWTDDSPYPYVTADDGWDGLGSPVTIYLPRTRPGDPNVDVGDPIAYVLDSLGDAYCVSDYLDEKIGTVKMWGGDVGNIPRGWAIMDGIANASPGSGINLIGYMLEMSDTAGVELAEGSTGSYEGGSGTIHVNGETDETNLAGVTSEETVSVGIGPGGAGKTQNASSTGNASGVVVDLDDTALTIVAGGGVSTYTGSGGPTQTACAGDNITIDIEDAGEHAHDLIGSGTRVDEDLDGNLVLPECTDTQGLHTHGVVYPDTCFVHKHAISGHDHTLTIGTHTHGIAPTVHSHGTYPHCHPVQNDPHYHLLVSHGHGAVAGSHAHNVISGAHSHGIDGVISYGGSPHTHTPGKPGRKTLIPIERVA